MTLRRFTFLWAVLAGLVLAFLVLPKISAGVSAQTSQSKAQNADAALQVQSKAVQSMTVKALEAIQKGRWDQGLSFIVSTKDPLSAKLYLWLSYVNNREDRDFVRLTHFIRQNPEWPAMGALRDIAEKNMPDDLPAASVVAWYDDYPPRTSKGLDRYIGAIFDIGLISKAQKTLSDWWVNTPLSRQDQKYLFRKYGKYLTKNAHAKRLDMLLIKGQIQNAMAIAGVLGEDYKALARARIALAEQKHGVDALVAQVPKALSHDAGLMYERIRWRRRHDNNAGAIALLKAMPKADELQNPNAWWRERHIIIRRLLEKKRYEQAYNLAKDHGVRTGLSFAQGEWISGWLALRFLDKPAAALMHFETLYMGVKTPISRARAAYWAGRALGKLSDFEGQKKWYKTAAAMQTVFYGQIAASEIAMTGQFPNRAPPNLTFEDLQKFRASELIQASMLFHRAGQKKRASQFINAFVEQNASAKAYRFAAELSADLKNYHDAVRIAKQATKNGLFLTAQSYPLIRDMMQGVDLEWALVHGLIRQESAFDVDARSPVGALGLMQLMPATAKEVARRAGVRHQTAWLTSMPSHNVRLGTAYLERLLKRYNGAYPLAIAAYNAGPGRVDDWVDTFGNPMDGDIDILDWIELIPIYETRNYVQRVVEATYVYRLRLRGAQKNFVRPVNAAMPENLRSN